MSQSQPTPVPPATEWVDRYGDYLYRYALLRLKNPATAEDVVQETFLGALKGLDRFDGRTDIKFWLRGILRNKIVDHIRKAVREDVVEDTEARELLDSTLYKLAGVAETRPAPWQFDPHRAMEKTEFWAAFRTCLEQLRDPLRTAFTLKMLEDLPSEEICKILRVSANHFWVIMHRARNQLKQCLEAKWARVE